MIRCLWNKSDWNLVDFSTSLSLVLFTMHINTVCFRNFITDCHCKWWNQICLFRYHCRYLAFSIYSSCYRDVKCLKRQHNSISPQRWTHEAHRQHEHQRITVFTLLTYAVTKNACLFSAQFQPLLSTLLLYKWLNSVTAVAYIAIMFTAVV